MRIRIFLLALAAITDLSAQNSLFQDNTEPIDYNLEMADVTVVGHNEIRKLREAAMPVSVLGARQLEGTATSVNDVLTRTAGVTIRNSSSWWRWLTRTPSGRDWWTV